MRGGLTRAGSDVDVFEGGGQEIFVHDLWHGTPTDWTPDEADVTELQSLNVSVRGHHLRPHYRVEVSTVKVIQDLFQHFVFVLKDRRTCTCREKRMDEIVNNIHTYIDTVRVEILVRI